MFGQIPTNGGYRHSRGGVFGQAPVYVEPPYVNDGGLLRIQSAALQAFKWSINMTTSSDPAKGATTHMTPGYVSTYAIEAVSVAPSPGDAWLDAFLGAGYVVLFRGKPVGELSQKLTFIATTDPRAVAAFASASANDYMIVDGPEPIITAARALVGTATPPVATPPTTTPPTTGACPPGTLGIPPLCVPTTIPGTVPGTIPGTIPGTLPGTTPGTPPPGTTPMTPPGTTPVAKAGAGAVPGWLLPALIGIGVVSLVAIAWANSKKEGR